MTKSVFTFFLVVILVVALHAFKAMQQTGITGKIVPQKGTITVSASNGYDLVSTQVVNNTFALTVKPGTWMVSVNTGKQLKNVLVNVIVPQGNMVDVGEIKLQ